MSFEKKVFSKKVDCPVCFKKNCASLFSYDLNDNYFGKVNVMTTNCLTCGFRGSDFAFLEKRKPKIYKIEISCLDDLKIRVMKGFDCNIEILEMGFLYEGSKRFQGAITNIEGLLLDFKKGISLLRNEENFEKIEKVKSDFDKILKGEKKITLCLTDFSGNSCIISPKVKISDIEK